MDSRAIDIEYFNQIKKFGSAVPRDKRSGQVLYFVVGKSYEIKNNQNQEKIICTCTQDCPTNLKSI